MLISQAKNWRDFFSRSVIPCDGKQALYSWQRWQTELINNQQLELQFANSGAKSLAVICGGHLACLDIDSTDMAQQFRAALPSLWDTTRHKSPRGYHVFYYVSQFPVTSWRVAGADFLHDGRYVLIPPSSGYRGETDTPPRNLSRAEYQSICRFFGVIAGVSQTPPADATLVGHGLLSAFPCPTLINEPQNPEADPESALCTKSTLLSFFRRALNETKSRNQTLFRAASWAHSQHIAQETTIEILLQIFVHTEPLGEHRHESNRARAREGRATIASAYAGSCYNVSRNPARLPAAAHQKLSAMRLTAFARAQDKLCSEIGPGSTIGQGDVACLDTDWGMRHWVEVVTSNGLSDQTKKVPPAPPSKHAGAGSTDSKIQTSNDVVKNTEKQCNCRSAIPTKTQNLGGRPRFEYRIPTPRQVCQWLNITYYLVDDMPDDALDAKTPMRIALYQGLIRRAPASSTRWQARVFGVNPSTIRRWREKARVRGMNPPIARLDWLNLHHLLPESGAKQDHWIETPDGKRYPANRIVLFKLWKGKRAGITLHSRFDHIYFVEGESMTVENPRTYARNTMPKLRKRQRETWLERGTHIGTPLENQELEGLALHLYDKLNTSCNSYRGRGIKLDTMRQVVQAYDVETINQAIMLASRKATVTKNPVGYFLSILKRNEDNS